MGWWTNWNAVKHIHLRLTAATLWKRRVKNKHNLKNALVADCWFLPGIAVLHIAAVDVMTSFSRTLVIRFPPTLLKSLNYTEMFYFHAFGFKLAVLVARCVTHLLPRSSAIIHFFPSNSLIFATNLTSLSLVTWTFSDTALIVLVVAFAFTLICLLWHLWSSIQRNAKCHTFLRHDKTHWCFLKHDWQDKRCVKDPSNFFGF